MIFLAFFIPLGVLALLLMLQDLAMLRFDSGHRGLRFSLDSCSENSL